MGGVEAGPWHFSLSPTPPPLLPLQAMVLRSRTADRKQGLIIAALVFATHWLYLKYLHYAYATLVQGELLLCSLSSDMFTTQSQHSSHPFPLHP